MMYFLDESESLPQESVLRAQCFDFKTKRRPIKVLSIRGQADNSIAFLPVALIVVHDNGFWNEFQLKTGIKKSL